MSPIGFDQIVALSALAVSAIVAISGFIRSGHTAAADRQRTDDKLDRIASDVKETRDSVREINRKLDDHTERIAKVEQQLISLFKRVERIEQNIDEGKSNID